MTIDKLLGQRITFFALNADRGYTERHVLTIFAWDPVEGFRLGGPGFDPCWVPHVMWNRLVREGIIIAADLDAWDRVQGMSRRLGIRP
jgi:hypothetical protein